LHVRFNK